MKNIDTNVLGRWELALKTLVLAVSATFFCSFANAQGCVAVRNMGCSSNLGSLNQQQTGLVMKGDFVATTGYRYFKSFRHFRGSEEEAYRVEQGTEVINYFHSVELGLTYGLSNRWNITAVLPFNINNRSSMYEHYGNSVEANPGRHRFETSSAGLSDVRVSANYWLLDPVKHMTGNISLGFGVKAPTGKPDVQGTFHRLGQDRQPMTITRAVDQSIQLGDGGWGFNLEMAGYQVLFSRVALFYSGFYMANPRNVNNTLRNINLNPEDPFSYLSVADQYAGRVGFFYNLKNQVALSLGGRIEGIPATDLIGKSEGFRRPGYALSVEPGINVQWNKMVFSANVPLAVHRNRIPNTLDKTLGRHGDAAFADYVINASVSYFFHPNKKGQVPH